MDAITASFLQDTLRDRPVVLPPVWNPYLDLQQGYATGNQLDAAAAAAQKLALGDANLALLPTQRKFNTSLQESQSRLYQAKADEAEARAKWNLERYRGGPRSGTPGAPATYTLPSWDDTSPGASTPGGGVVPSTPPPAPTTASGILPDDGGTDLPVPATDALTPVSMNNSGAGAGADTFTAKATGYFPRENPEYMKDGHGLDRAGHRLYTLDEYRAGHAPYVSVSADDQEFKYGEPLASPQFPGVPFKVVDRGGAFEGKGTSRVDIARSSAKGANSDENNGHITFQRGATPPAGDSPAVVSAPLPTPAGGDEDAKASLELFNQPMVPVSGAYEPGDPQYNPAAAVNGTAGGIQVPRTDQEVLDLRAKVARNILAARSQPAYASDRNFRNAVNGLTQMWDSQSQHAIATYELHKQQQAHTEEFKARQQGRGGVAGDEDAPEYPGYYKIPTEATGGKVKYKYASEGDVSDDKFRQEQARRLDVENDVKTATGGATIADILNDRGHYNDAAPVMGKDGRVIAGGSVTPGTHYFTQTIIDPRTGVVQPIERGIPEPLYQRLRGKVDPLVYGGAPVTAPTPGAVPVRIPFALPQPGGVDNSSIPVPAPLPVTPAPGMSGAEKLAAEAAKVKPITDAEKELAPEVAEKTRKDTEDSAQAKREEAASAAQLKSLAYTMTQHVSGIDARRDALRKVLEEYKILTEAPPDSPYSNMGGVFDPEAKQRQLDVAKELKELEVRRAATLDKRHYKPLPGGGYEFDDPYDKSFLPTSFDELPTKAGNAVVHQQR